MDALMFDHVTPAIWAARAYALATGYAVRIYRDGGTFYLSHVSTDDPLVCRVTPTTARDDMAL